MKRHATVAEPAAVVAARKLSTDRAGFLHALLHGHPRFRWLWDQVRPGPGAVEELAGRADWAGGTFERRAAGSRGSLTPATRPGRRPASRRFCRTATTSS